MINYDSRGNYPVTHQARWLELGNWCAKQAIRNVGERGTYLDVHEWCFTTTSFRLMMRDLFELRFIQLKELAFIHLRAVSFTSRSRARACCRRAPALICCRRFIANNPFPEPH